MPRKKAEPGVEKPSGRRHRCEACGAVDIWREGWSTYGSILDEDDGRAVTLCPLAACHEKGPELLRRKPVSVHRPFGY